MIFLNMHLMGKKLIIFYVKKIGSLLLPSLFSLIYVMKLEKTCYCKEDYDGFRKGREYQLDWIFENGKEIYRVYLNGTYENSRDYEEETFRNYFTEID